MTSLINLLRCGEWLSRERMCLWALAILIASLGGLAFLIATSDGLSDYKGRPLGSDFSNIYAGGANALDGHAAAAFDPTQQYAREQAIFGPDTPMFGWHYPPFLLLIAAPLALMPYIPALVVWQVATLTLYLAMLTWLLRTADAGPRTRLVSEPLWPLLAIALPAGFVNIYHGHNGFLTAALIGGALVALDRRPILAGVLIGLLAYKPQFGVLIPLVLIATGRWRCFCAATVTVAMLALAVTALFGVEVWRAFIDFMPFTQKVVLEQGDFGWHKFQSVFAWVRMWGGSVELAYLCQGATAVMLAVALVGLWRSRAADALKAAALIIAAVLATPYSVDYDYLALAPAIAFLAADGCARGFAPWQKTALAALWLMPFVARVVAGATMIPLGVPTMVAAFALIIHRAVRDGSFDALSGLSLRPAE